MSKLHTQLCDRRAYRFAGREVVAAGSRSAFEAAAIIGVTLHNQALALCDCLQSINEQRDLPLSVTVLVLDDDSEDEWQGRLESLAPRNGLVVAQAVCGSAALARNRLLDVADAAFPNAQWVARLDADDRLASPNSLAALLQKAICSDAKFVLAGNRLRRNGKLLKRTNPAKAELLRADYVLSRLAGMARGEPEAELPSCNLLLATHSGWRYPEQTSGEDHWLVAELLLRHADKGAILTELFYADYELEGATTALNHRQARHLSARQTLLQTALKWGGKEKIGA